MASKRVKAALAALTLLSCAHAPAAPRAAPWQAVFLGDPGWPGEIRASADRLVRAQLRYAAQTVVVVPGDLFYETGLPDDCAAARQRVEREYVDVFPGLDFFVVPGNHDHGDPNGAYRPDIAARTAYFDCAQRDAAAPLVGWIGERSCDCVPRWHAPVGVGLVGTAALGPVTLIAFDSQGGLTGPETLGEALARTLSAAPSDRPVLLVGHHPIDSSGPHGTGSGAATGNLASPAYRRYREVLLGLLREHRAKILLSVFGHEHLLEFRPEPPTLTAGAGSKVSAVMRFDAPGSVAIGSEPGIAVLSQQATGRFGLELSTPSIRRRLSLTPER